MNYKKVLALSPHTDDVELGAGATMARLAEDGAHIQTVAFSAPGDTLKSEMSTALFMLMGNTPAFTPPIILDFPRRQFPRNRQQILQWLWDYRAEFDPDLVLVPCSTDQHQDHQVIRAEAMRVFKNVTMFGYILHWNCQTIIENVLVPIQKRHLEAKINALNCYASQGDRRYFDPEFHRAEAYTRGLAVDSHLAESFELIHLVHDEGAS